MEFLNEPSSWKHEPTTNTIEMVTKPKSDFWRTTHYGFIRDNGHFYYKKVKGDFVVNVKVTGDYKVLYDQAGIMVRLNENVWIKTGIEYVEGVQQVSAVVTRQFSDWSVTPFPENPPSVWLKLSRRKEAIEVQYSFDGKLFSLLRLAYLTEEETLDVD